MQLVFFIDTPHQSLDGTLKVGTMCIHIPTELPLLHSAFHRELRGIRVKYRGQNILLSVSRRIFFDLAHTGCFWKREAARMIAEGGQDDSIRLQHSCCEKNR